MKCLRSSKLKSLSKAAWMPSIWFQRAVAFEERADGFDAAIRLVRKCSYKMRILT
jgi:hypothetical protein